MPTAQRPDPIRALRAFAQVARLGSVSRAAEALGLSQPAVTLQLQALARHHGVVLLERSGRRLVPTAAGEALLGLARPLVDGLDGLDAALHARLRSQAPDALAVAAGTVALARLLPHAVEAVAPGALAVHHAGGARALDLLRDGTVALAVGSWLAPPGDVDVAPLLQAPARLLVPEGHRLARLERPGPADLAGETLLLPRGRDGTRQLVDLPLGRAGVAVVAGEAGDWTAIANLVALGQGISVSNALALGEGPPDGVAVRPLHGFPARPYGVATRRGRPATPAGRALVEALRGAAARRVERFDDAGG